MGSVYQRQDRRWVAKYADVHGHWSYVYRGTRAEAEEALKEAIKDQEAGISPNKLTVSDYLRQHRRDHPSSHLPEETSQT